MSSDDVLGQLATAHDDSNRYQCITLNTQIHTHTQTTQLTTTQPNNHTNSHTHKQPHTQPHTHKTTHPTTPTHTTTHKNSHTHKQPHTGGIVMNLTKMPRPAKSVEKCGLRMIELGSKYPTINLFKNKRYWANRVGSRSDLI